MLHVFDQAAMATRYELRLEHEDADYARQAARACFAELRRIEGELSRFIEGSEIDQLNALEPGGSLRVSPAAFECVSFGWKLWRLTGGRFDIAYRALAAGQPPSPLQHLRFDPDTCEIGLETGRLDLDLGALGKGYALDFMSDLLGEWGIGRALLHGGESSLVVLGAQPERVCLRTGAEESGPVIEVADASLSGSACELKGRHIESPGETGAAMPWRAAWCLAPTGMVSDALSTALMLMPPGELPALLGQCPGVRLFVAGWDDPSAMEVTAAGLAPYTSE